MSEQANKKSSSKTDGQGMDDEGADGAVEDTNTASPSSDEDGSAGDWDADDEDDEPMPYLSYSRLFGSLPRRRDDGEAPSSRRLTVPATCSVMGKVVFSQQDSMAIPQSNSAGAASTASPESVPANDQRAANSPDPRRLSPQTAQGDLLLRQQPHFVLAMGHVDGSMDLVDARTGVAVAHPDQLRLRDPSHQPESIVDLSMDSSGTFLAAVDAGRMVVIWEFQYTITTTSVNMNAASPASSQPMASSQIQQSPPPDAGVFSSFMSALAGAAAVPTQPQSAASSPRMPGQLPLTTALSSSGSMVPRLAVSSIQLSRISYPRSFGVPTCIAIDPSYKRGRRDKAVLTGFLDGRLVLTKRGYMFQRRTDAVIYQGTYHRENNNHRGIEAIEWRGSLAAWADASGIRLFDTESLSRIAHIDRPSGARPSLYPTLSALRPSLCFEREHYLIVAWGDCLMGLSITDHSRTSEGQNNNQNDNPLGLEIPQQQPAVRRRTVECAMAWELDCVASGVVPLDDDHVLVLGVVPPADDDDEEEDEVGSNDVELQIVAKVDGSIVFSNILPLLKDVQTPQQSLESASDYNLLSTFALPRMDDVFEAAAQEIAADDDFDIQVNIFTTTNQVIPPFVDPHLKWNLKDTFDGNDERNVVLTVDENLGGDFQHISTKNNRQADDDAESVDSDDYGFVFRPLPTTSADNGATEQVPAAGTPPLILVASTADVVLARMRDVDDAIAHALESGKSALALRRGLCQRRRVRKFQVVTDLVNEYFASLLRIPTNDCESNKRRAKALSVRRLKLAARAMPVLFGGEIALWQRWVGEMQRIPGALFILSDHLPVRDPILPKQVYGQVLSIMLTELEEMNNVVEGNQDDDVTRRILAAESKFLTTLIGWGPTSFLKEFVKLCKADGRLGGGNAVAANDAEERFARRFTQSSAGYLNFPILAEGSATGSEGQAVRSDGYHEEKESLFDIDEVASMISRNASLASDDVSGVETDAKKGKNSHAALDAMAKLNMMRGRYDAALKCFLFIGALHSSRPLSEFESGAVDFVALVGDREVDRPWKTESGASYTYLLDVIDSHNLHQCLLDVHFLSALGPNEVPPLFALLQLVGFRELGNFLIEHCVPPQLQQFIPPQTNDSLVGVVEERRGTIPLDLVANQLKQRAPMLLWYLQLVFMRKPEVYVRFPNTAYPPQAVTDLHRLHFDLCVKYSGREKDSAWFCSQVEAYKVANLPTRLLQFMKVALPLGGIRILDAKKALESERNKEQGPDFPQTFALEMAYLVEMYGKETEEEAKEVLDLYMKGAQALVLAVSFAQRTTAYSSRLWQALIEYCLAHDGGRLFGALLEAAALSGADVAKLVKRIPPGMAIEGLRPRLVASVADYRLKLKMHEAASEGATKELRMLLQELSHRSRRGSRYELHLSSTVVPNPFGVAGTEESKEEFKDDNDDQPKAVQRSALRPHERRDRHRHTGAPTMQ